MPTSPLTPRRGYTFTLSQVIGGRPRVAIGCTRCHYLAESQAVDLEAATDEALGRIVRAALDEWGSHMCDVTYPSEPHARCLPGGKCEVGPGRICSGTMAMGKR